MLRCLSHLLNLLLELLDSDSPWLLNLVKVNHLKGLLDALNLLLRLEHSLRKRLMIYIYEYRIRLDYGLSGDGWLEVGLELRRGRLKLRLG